MSIKMSSITLLLDSNSSDNVIAGRQTSDDFEITFNPPLQMPKTENGYEVGLIKANMWYSIANISADFNNNYFRYFNGAVFRDVIIPDGLYNIEDINDYLHQIMVSNGDFTVGPPNQYDIELKPNFNTLKTNLTLSNGYQLDLSVSDLYLLLGGEQIIYNFTGFEDFANKANLNRDINNFIISCSIIDGNYSLTNSNKNNTLMSFVFNVPPGSNYEINDNYKLFVPISLYNGANLVEVKKIRMTITDNLGRRVDFNQEPVTYLLNIKPIR